MGDLKNVAIVGVTGAVGRLTLKLLEERDFPIRNIALVAADDAQTKALVYKGDMIEVQAVESFDYEGFDLVIFCVPTPASEIYVPQAVAAGAMVIDNSNFYRTDPDVPIIVPEVNGDQIINTPKNIIANGNCAAMQMVVALGPLHQHATIKRVVVSSYQSVSGVGHHAMEELSAATHKYLAGQSHIPGKFPRDIAFNVIPQVDMFREDGRTIEEWKMEHDTQKIMDTDFPVSATCVRVPVLVGHSEAVSVEFESDITPAQAVKILSDAPSVIVQDQAENFTVPRDVVGTDDVYVSRIRQDASVAHGLNFWVVSDNLRKGAALNNIQIAELWLKSL